MQSHRLVEIPESLINEVQFEIPEAPHESINVYVKKSICEFCEGSHYWKEEIGPISLQKGIDSYDIDAPRGATIISITRVSFVESAQEVELLRVNSGDARYSYWQTSSTSIQFSSASELVGKNISIIASLKPDIESSSFKFSETILRDYRDCIAAGAKAKIYMAPRKPWSDPSLAQVNQSIFTSSTHEALRSMGRGFSRLPDRACPVARSYY